MDLGYFDAEGIARSSQIKYTVTSNMPSQSFASRATITSVSAAILI